MTGVTMGVVLLTAAPAQAESREQADTLWAIGTAWSGDQQEILYQEIHFTNNAELDLTTRVEYRRPDGELFAEKHIDYSDSLIFDAGFDPYVRLNWDDLVGWLVDPIHIGYHRDTRRLMSFDGISNFRDDAGNTRNVLIKFEYF